MKIILTERYVYGSFTINDKEARDYFHLSLR